MGWTQDEVDKYVAKVERNTNDPTEKNLKGFAFARLYREAKDNNKAKRHLEAYLSVNEADFRGHRMMGQLFEETGNLEKALTSYRRSLDLNNTQHDLVLKVVELYCQVPVDPDRARAWADRAARLYPGHTAVFKLRMHLLESAGKIDYDQMEDLISEEMAKRPRDAELHIRLVKVYASTGRLIDAFTHCVSVIKTKAFTNSQEWWRCAIDVFERYMVGQNKMIPSDRDIGPGHAILDLHAQLLGALCQLLSLYLKTESIRECRNAFYRLDHCLNMAHERKVRQLPRANHRSEWEVVLTEMRGQLYLHCGTLVLRLAKENYLTWPRALKLASVCYLTSIQVIEPEINTPWVATAPKAKDALRWYRMSCHRLSHSGHLLGEVANKYGEEWLDACISDWCTQQGQDEVLNTIYNQNQDISKSFLANDEDYCLLELHIPSPEQMIKYDEVCVSDNPRNLQLLVWIGLHWHQFEGKMRPGVGVIVSRIFDGLRMDAHNIEQTAADTMSLRDLEAFLYAVIKTSSAKHLDDQEIYRPDYQPHILPHQLCVALASPAQEQWWLAAYNLYSGAASVNHTGKVRATVQRGLEIIRATGNHGLHVRLLIFLAHNFGDKASYLKAAGVSPWHYEEHWKSLQARSLHYWKEVLVLLEKFERNESIPVRKDPLFDPLQDSLQKVDIKFNIQKARLILGEAAIKEGRIEEAMEMFEQVKTTQGMWNLAQIYKYLSNVEAQAAASEDLGVEAHSSAPAQEYYNCLNKAKDLLLVCMERVGTEERRRQILQDELNDLEDRLNEDPNKAQKATRKQLDFRQLDFQASRSSTTMSDAQESEDNFWLDQPQDGGSKDLIAKLSEVTLNNGYLQEQMAIRDQFVLDLTNKVQNLECEIRELKLHQFSGVLSPANFTSNSSLTSVTTRATPTTMASPITQGTPVMTAPSSTSITPTGSHQRTQQNGYPTESTPVAKPSVKSRLGPRIPAAAEPELPVIDANFFAGLSQSNSPDRRIEQKENEEEEEEEQEEQGSPRHGSYDDGIHFEPIIPLPKKVEKKTGEEGKKVLFSKRAKLYRFVKDEKAWKERGHGTLKILSSEDSSRFRILMRRDHILKICANHLITSDMELQPLKSGSVNSLVWTTFADYADEIPRIEQLAVRFKLPEQTAEFKEVFEECKSKLTGASKTASPEDVGKSDQGGTKSTVSPKAVSWTCSICSVKNLVSTSVCGSCGAAKLSNNTEFPISKVDGATPLSPEKVTSSSEKAQSLFAKYLPKPGSWECSHCLVNNQASASSCIACGTRKPTVSSIENAETTSKVGGESPFNTIGKDSSTFSFGPKGGASTKLPLEDTSAELDSISGFPFEFKPESSLSKETDQGKPKKSIFVTQPAPFSFAYQPTSSSGSPLTFSFGPTQAPTTTLSPSSTTTASAGASASFPSLFGAPPVSKISETTTNSSPIGFSFGSSELDAKDTSQTQDKPLTFSSSPSGVLPGFGISDDEDDDKEKGSTAGVSGSQTTPKSSTKEQPGVFSAASQEPTVAPAATATTIMPQMFWQQQLEEKFKFGNLHKTQPLAGMAPAFSPVSGKADVLYPASFILSHMAGGSPTGSQAKPSTGTASSTSQVSQRPEMLISLLQGKPKESFPASDSESLKGASSLPTSFASSTTASKGVHPFKTTQEIYDDYSDDDDETETEDSESYDSSEGDFEEGSFATAAHRPTPLLQKVLTQKANSSYNDSAAKASERGGPATGNLNQNPGISGRKFLTPRSPLKKGQPPEDECVIVYQIRSSKADQDKASRLLLPPNFFNYVRSEPCPGCLGCCDQSKLLALKQKTSDEPARDNMSVASQPKQNESQPKERSSIFGNSSVANEFSFTSFASSDGWASSKKRAEHRAFPMAGKQLFASAESGVDPSQEAEIHFKPLISLPDIVEVKSGEEDHTLLFSERARLYRFDTPSSMWKERGIGDIKLLLDNKSGRGRVVMRRDQVHKLCANHWVTKDMELMTNSSSDRSWIWQTLSDFSEEVPSHEKLAVRFKSSETAAKFKEVFNDLIALAKKCLPQNDTKEEVEIQSVQPKAGTWSCDSCYCENTDKDINCPACGSAKKQLVTHSTDANQDTIIPTSPSSAATKSVGKSMPKLVLVGEAGKDKMGSKPVFTIGRGDVPEEVLEKESYMTSPSRSSPSKSPVKLTPPQLTLTSTKDQSSFEPAFGALASAKFKFRLELQPDEGTPAKSPVKTPQSPQSPGSPGFHPETEDDGIHFEPVIPLPKLVSKTTGEENEDTLFCQRAKVFRYDPEGNQWKERGVGEAKILKNTKSGKSRILMRRDNVLKICVNHQITSEMDLQPKTEKSWVWNTLADFADQVPKAETLAIRFKTTEIAIEFKGAFEKVKDEIAGGTSGEKPTEILGQDKVDASHEGEPTQQKSNDEDKGDDQYKGSSADQKTSSTPKEEQSPNKDKEKSLTKKEKSPSTGFLFGSSNISTLSFASVAANVNSSPVTGDDVKNQGFEAVGSKLFSKSPSPRKGSESEEHHDDGPHFEPIIPLPEKIEVKTGEEDEDVVFSHRAKLYRFDKELKQWKERGVGDIKILYHKKNGHARILMRRDQILKICANHYVTPEMKLAPSGTANKSWIWNTLADFSDEEVKAEQLAVRFKLEATAQEFKERFEECQEKVMRMQDMQDMQIQENKTPVSESLSDHKPDDQPTAKDAQTFMDKFKPKSGTWECEVCCISNDPESTTCPACQSPKPGCKPQQSSDNLQHQPKFQFGAPLKPPVSTGFSFSFGEGVGDDSKAEPSSSTPEVQTSLLDKFKPKPGAWECEECLVLNKSDSMSCASCQTTKPNSDPSQASSIGQPSFSFGGPKPTGFSFGSSKSDNQTPFSFGPGFPSASANNSIMDTFQPNPGQWECEACLVLNKSESTTCDACQSPKPGLDSSQVLSSAQIQPPSSFGGPKPTGFTFDSSSTGNEQPFSFGTGFSFVSPEVASSSDITGNKPSEDNEAKDEPVEFHFGAPQFHPSPEVTSSSDITGNKPSEGNEAKDEPVKFHFGAPKGNKGKQSIMMAQQPEPGTWECETCLIQNKAGSTTCAACQTLKPGSDTSQPSSIGQPSFNFGSSKPTVFTFSGSKSEHQNPFSFGSGFSFAPTTANTPPNQPGSEPLEADKEQSKPQFMFGDPKPTGFSFGTTTNNSPSPFSFGPQPHKPPFSTSSTSKEQTSPCSSSDTNTSAIDGKEANAPDDTISPKTRNEATAKEHGEQEVPLLAGDDTSLLDSAGKSLNLSGEESNVEKSEADSTSSPEIQEIYSSISPETTDQNLNMYRSRTSQQKSAPEEIDPTITTVVEPSNEEKDRAKGLLLPEGFFLYQRKPNADLEASRKTKKEQPNVPETKPVEHSQEDEKQSPKSGVFGSSSSQPFASFSDVCGGQSFQFGGTKATKGFAGTGSQLFSSDRSKGGDANTDEERDIHFEPIVELPKVEVVTGEEHEEKVFSHRSKLYRFDQSISQWKERGVGEIKILKLKDGHKFRVLMRRDQIHKLCANHILTTDMKLVPNAASDRSWVWYTLADLSEEEPTPEKFAVRFKYSSVAEEFKKAFEDCQQKMREKTEDNDSASEQGNSSEEGCVEDDVEIAKQPVQLSKASHEIGKKLSFAGELFTKNAATTKAVDTLDAKVTTENWECGSCYTLNHPAERKCLSCGEPKQVEEPVNVKTLGDKESLDEKSCDDVQHDSGADSSVAKETNPAEESKTGFLFGTQSISSLSFSDAAKSNLFGEVSSSEPFSFKGLNDPQPDHGSKEDDDHEEGYHNVSGDHIHFDPIIPLPEKVQVVTGEEKEEILFKERGKLYRFDTDAKQWKERGVGELKILSSNGRARIVMRRDHIHKLCANHIITSDMVLTQNGNSDRSWVWQTLADFSEEEPKAEQLAVRFKTAEIANSFKKTFEECTAQELNSNTTECENVKDTEKPLSDEPAEDDVKSKVSVSSKCPESALVPKPENTQYLACTFPSQTQFTSGAQSKVVQQQSVRTSSTITKQEFHQQSTSTTTFKVEKTASLKAYQEQRVEQSGGKETEETAAFSVQDQAISSSTEGNSFSFPQSQRITSSPSPSVFNQELMSQRGAGFSTGGIFPLGQSTFPSSPPSSQFPGIGNTQNITKVSSSTQQISSKHSEVTSKESDGQVVEERKVVQSMEARKVETTQSVSSSSVVVENQPVSCSPEITKMLQEIQDSDKK